ncbi:MAG: metallophosphoesterase family protein [Treponema sp.]|nr:metallophosphoesterase family protein [Treponema sp.]
MRWLILSDIHGDFDALAKVLEHAGSVDAIIIAGDLTDFGGHVEATKIIDALAEKEAPVLAVSGNCDRDGVRAALESAGLSIEGRTRKVRDHIFAGAGGGIHHHGMTPFEPTEDELEASLSAALNSGDEFSERRIEGENLVIVTHTPPNGTPLDKRGSTHTGSHAFRAILGERTPALWVSGHIHEARSLWTIGPTVLVNPGPVREGCFALAIVDGKGSPRLSLEMIDLRHRPLGRGDRA